MDPKDDMRGGLQIGDLPIATIEARDQRTQLISPISAIGGPIVSQPLSWTAPPAPAPVIEPVVQVNDVAPVHEDDELAASGDRDADSPSARTLEVLAACDASDPRFETAEDPRIPTSQMYFKIGEVAKITGIKPYVLRYWEVEFPWIRPEKTSSRQRRYRRQDVALLLRISRLRYQEELTIDRTRQVIREDRRAEHAASGRSRGAKKKIAPKPASVATQDVAGAALDDVALQLTLGLGGTARSTQATARILADMRRTVLELLEAVEE